MKLHHIGIIVKELEKSIKIYSLLGYIQLKDTIIDYIQYNRIAFLKKEGEPLIELIEPLDRRSSVGNFKEGYHHLCYEVIEDNNVVELIHGNRIGKVFTESIVAPALNNKVRFALLSNGTFIELIIGEQNKENNKK